MAAAQYKEQIIWADSALAARLTESQIEEIIERHTATGDLVAMVEDAYALIGVDGDDADHTSDYVPYQ